jgi:hypothetical protein
MSQKIADLFIDINLRGGGKIELLALRDKILASDKALANNADMYGRQTSAKIKQMTEIAKRAAELAKSDQSTYGSMKYGKAADAQANAEIEREIANRQKSIALSKAERAVLAGRRGDVSARMEAKDTADALLKNQEKAIALGKAELTLHKGKQGAEVAQKTLQAERIKKQVDEVKLHQRMVAEHGKIGATLRERASLLSRISPGALMGLGIGGITVGHAVGQASPIHAETLSKSFDLLAAHIGTLLLPVVDQLSFALQRAAVAAEEFRNRANNVQDSMPLWLKEFLDPGGYFGLNPNGTVYNEQNPRNGQPQRPATMPAHFEAFDQAWKRIQQEAAGRGPLEQQIYDLQMRNLPAQTAALQTIAANMPNQPPPQQMPPIGNNN